MIRILILLGLLWGTPLMAAPTYPYSFGLGLWSQNILTTTAKESGAANTFGTPNYVFHVRGYWPAWELTTFSPRLGYTLLPRDLKDSAGTFSALHLSFPFTQNFSGSTWDWSYGLGYLNQTIKGKGGTEIGSNGGSPAIFYRPNGNSNSTVITTELGIGYNFPDSRLDFDLFIIGIMGERRSYNLLVSWSYGFSGLGATSD